MDRDSGSAGFLNIQQASGACSSGPGIYKKIKSLLSNVAIICEGN